MKKDICDLNTNNVCPFNGEICGKADGGGLGVDCTFLVRFRVLVIEYLAKGRRNQIG